MNDAQVACHEMGLGPAITARRIERDRGHRVWLDDLQCVGTEWTIGNCSHKGWSVHDCQYYDAAGVECATG